VAGRDVFAWASEILDNLQRIQGRRSWFGRVA